MKIIEKIIWTITSCSFYMICLVVVMCIQKTSYGRVDELITWSCTPAFFFLTKMFIDKAKRQYNKEQ